MRLLAIIIFGLISQICAKDSCIRQEYLIDHITYAPDELCIDSVKQQIKYIESGEYLNLTDSISQITKVFGKHTFNVISDYTKLTIKYIAGGLIVMSGIFVGGKDIGEFGMRLINDRESYDCYEENSYSLLKTEFNSVSISDAMIDYCEDKMIPSIEIENVDTTNSMKSNFVIQNYGRDSTINDNTSHATLVPNNVLDNSEWKPKHSYSVTAGVAGAIVTTIAGFYLVSKLGLMEPNDSGIPALPPAMILTPLITIPLGVFIGIGIDELFK